MAYIGKLCGVYPHSWQRLCLWGRGKKKLSKETTQKHTLSERRGSENSLMNTGSAHTSELSSNKTAVPSHAGRGCDSWRRAGVPRGAPGQRRRPRAGEPPGQRNPRAGEPRSRAVPAVPGQALRSAPGTHLRAGSLGGRRPHSRVSAPPPARAAAG